MALDLTDKTSNGNGLTNSGAAEYTSDFPFAASTEAVSCVSGESDHLYAVDSTSLSPTNDITLECWVKITSGQTGNLFIIAKDNDPERSYALFVDQASDLNTVYALAWKTGGGQSLQGGSSTFASGAWHHIAMTYHYVSDGGSRLRVFLDGVQDGETTAAV